MVSKISWVIHSLILEEIISYFEERQENTITCVNVRLFDNATVSIHNNVNKMYTSGHACKSIYTSFWASTLIVLLHFISLPVFCFKLHTWTFWTDLAEYLEQWNPIHEKMLLHHYSVLQSDIIVRDSRGNDSGVQCEKENFPQWKKKPRIFTLIKIFS